ncbi:glycosyl transferase [Candidatus Roizmanbacteria bacterium CG10_big_fil_rev_8_21_14_0_10_39_12]|uniref:Glycosyl transferase n=1 Tax=Candidatus Roizmanbacteria bacterium CG10_big_fil_rev_8_21_14_0_10_39_12 TaxID=1974852 RepID=A0A2M8KMY4_9BACT|nr:MAG: glycosyl transferase [Candidatus Roizmanbacteria bacterium CG10_big_fil_rev_8_21_14_0_10_39_12]
MQKVSVVIPTKNSRKTIRRCLRSVRDQTYPNIEIIVVDNYSTDNTIKIAQKFTDFVFSASPERSAQRNYGVRKATGQFVMIVDSDMYLSRSVIQECVEALKNDIIGIYIPEKILGNSFWTEVRNFERGFYNSTCVDAVRFLRKKDFEKIGGFDEQLRVAEDWDFDRRIRKLGKTTEIFAHVFHDESSFAIRKYIGKKKTYFHGLQIYIKKWNNDADVKKQIGFIYRMIWVFIENNKWRRLIRHPILSIAMLVLRTLMGTEYLLSKITIKKN